VKRRLFLALTTCLMACLGDAKATPHLEGCANASEIAKPLATLAARDWRQVSLGELRQVWPTELAGLNCDSDVCHSVWSKDRIISGQCECCATFSFKVQSGESGSRREQLDEVIINYSIMQRDQIVVVAKEFAVASGLKDADVATIGRDPVQNFHWTSPRGKDQELSGIELRINHRGRLWELYFNWGRNLVEPLAASSK
jgi:hypothetical protein